MYFLIVKYICTAAIVVVVSEVAKRSAKLGSLISAMPLMTLYVNSNQVRIGSHHPHSSIFPLTAGKFFL